MALDPLYFQAWNNLALQLDAAGKKDEAEQILRRLLQNRIRSTYWFLQTWPRCSSAKSGTRDAERAGTPGDENARLLVLRQLYSGTALVNEGKLSDEAKTKLEYAQLKYPEAKKLLHNWPEPATHN